MLETCPGYPKISQPTPPLCPTLQGQFPRSRTCSSPSTASPWRGTLSPFIPAQLEAIRGREERTYLLIEDEDLSYDGDPRVVRALLGREFAEVGLLVIFLSPASPSQDSGLDKDPDFRRNMNFPQDSASSKGVGISGTSCNNKK